MVKRPLSAGFPVKPKEKEFDLSSKALTGPMGTRTYQYWTNFTRNPEDEFKVVTDNPELKGYWWFVTNLEPEDFEYTMTPVAIRSFLYKMMDIYWSPGA